MVLGLLAVSATECIAAQPVFKPMVPDTISPEAQDFIRGLPDPATYPGGPAATDLEGWRKFRAANEDHSKASMAAIRQQYQPTITSASYNGVPVLDIKPKGWTGNGAANDRVIVFIHGGGYVLGSAASSLGASVPLAHDSGLRVISVDYTTAPFAPYGKMLDEIIAVIKGLEAEGYQRDHIAMVGASAGGGLASGTALKMIDDGLGMVGALVLWSPAGDLTGRGETMTSLSKVELAFSDKNIDSMMDVVAPAAERKKPYLSPVYGDYSRGYPPTLIQVGTREMLLSTSVRLYQAIDTAGATAKLDVYEGMFHTFQEIKPGLPESVLARRKTVDFLRHYLKISN
ncbi:alpha/beta hydrolase [Govanella unica]|uniref:Alpha/beta hydrolase n=1 Tax=Govanella unica TaxID=2975056 RepID=A0A9X3TVW2_9PROT|nr:alpha/beta hydrolase [Govania unica]MDA5192685.1 alpha/beta hydrolase [Govania unica]